MMKSHHTFNFLPAGEVVVVVVVFGTEVLLSASVIIQRLIMYHFDSV